MVIVEFRRITIVKLDVDADAHYLLQQTIERFKRAAQILADDGRRLTGGGQDLIRERVQPKYTSGDWPVMGEAVYIDDHRTAFSIEELLTIDFEEIPSRTD